MTKTTPRAESKKDADENDDERRGVFAVVLRGLTTREELMDPAEAEEIEKETALECEAFGEVREVRVVRPNPLGAAFDPEDVGAVFLSTPTNISSRGRGDVARPDVRRPPGGRRARAAVIKRWRRRVDDVFRTHQRRMLLSLHERGYATSRRGWQSQISWAVASLPTRAPFRTLTGLTGLAMASST